MVEQTLFERGISGEVPLVWLYAHGAKLAGEEVADLGRNPGALTRSLQACVDVVGVPAVAPTFDTGFEHRAVQHVLPGGDGIEAPEDAFDVVVEDVLGDGTIELILESTDRLASMLDEASVIGTLTAPRMLVDRLVDSDDPAALEEAWFLVEDVQIALANAYLDRGADGLMILPSAGFRDDPHEAGALRALANVAGHFDATTLAFVEAIDDEALQVAVDAGVDALAAPDGIDERLVGGHDVALGVEGSPERFRQGTVDRVRAELPAEVFLTSEAPLPPDIALDRLHDVLG